MKGSLTEKNLLKAFAGESQARNRYTYFASVARKEGFEDVAESFTEIAEVEEEHEKRYRKLLENVKKGIVFKRDVEVEWKCRNCGYVHHGKEVPEVCPACTHPRSYYELHAKNY